MAPIRNRGGGWLSALLLLMLLLQTTPCRSWNTGVRVRAGNNPRHSNRTPDSLDDEQPHDRHPSFRQPKHEEAPPSAREPVPNRRRALFHSAALAAAQLAAWQLLPPQTANAYSDASDGGIVTVRLASPEDSLGVEVYDTMLRGTTVVAIRRIVVPNANNRLLREGMVLRPKTGGSYTAKQLVDTLQSGTNYPLEISFANLAAGGDAISDLGSSIVTPKDALELAQQTESPATNNQGGVGYGITTIQQSPPNTCAIQSRRNDVLEIFYEAAYIDGVTGDKVVYDASAFRGTNTQPYQMVLGSGDMIPGVDQGLYDMCPGETRVLTIPPVLGHGPKSRKLYRIPDFYRNLEWTVGLVTIDGTIRADNNVVSRDDRESRFAY